VSVRPFHSKPLLESPPVPYHIAVVVVAPSTTPDQSSGLHKCGQVVARVCYWCAPSVADERAGSVSDSPASLRVFFCVLFFFILVTSCRRWNKSRLQSANTTFSTNRSSS
jgi:hypothetical protein